MSQLSLSALPQTTQSAFLDKTPADYPAQGVLVWEFDIWREGYAGKTVNIYRAGTTELVPVYTDINLTQLATNPQVLAALERDDGTSYGKFRQSLYSPYAYYAEIEGEEYTGTQAVPLTSLAGQDASNATVVPAGATVARALRDILSEVIRAKDFGEIGLSPETNTTTLTAAISAAATRGGGLVFLPSGTIPFTQLAIPASVILAGEGKDTTVLQSQLAGRVVTIAADSAGMRDLTLDGITLLPGSTGIYAKAKENIVLDNVKVKRFAVGLHWQGGNNHRYRNLDVENCVRNVRMLGDEDFTGTGGGALFTGLDWFGGSVAQSTSVGIELSVNDLEVNHNLIQQVDFSDNIGDDGALLVYGARFTKLYDCRFVDNTKDIVVQDNVDETLSFREVVGLQVYGGEIVGGTIALDGLCQDVVFDQVSLEGCTLALNVPSNQIILRDCTEQDTLFTGDATKVSRFRTAEDGIIAGTTTDGTPTAVYKVRLKPNEVMQVHVSATAEQINGTGKAAYAVVHSFNGQPALLNFDEQTVNFVVGSQIEGASSGATAVIVAQTDSGTTGTLSLGVVSGEFIDNEIINSLDDAGTARVNGTLTFQAAQNLGTTTSVRAVGNNTGSPPASWGGVTCDVLGQEGVVYVDGNASTDINWVVSIKSVRL